MKPLQNNLKVFRNASGLTQSEFGKKVFISKESVGSYEEGRAEPKIPLFLRICEMYGISPKEFYNKEFTLTEAAWLIIKNKKNESRN